MTDDMASTTDGGSSDDSTSLVYLSITIVGTRRHVPLKIDMSVEILLQSEGEAACTCWFCDFCCRQQPVIILGVGGVNGEYICNVEVEQRC